MMKRGGWIGSAVGPRLRANRRSPLAKRNENFRHPMQLTPINSAEAIFEAFFDEQLSGLPKWTVHGGEAEGLQVVQRWAWVHYEWQRPPADPATPALRMSRTLDLACADYESLMFSLLAPPGAR